MQAQRSRHGLTQILDWVGRESGIDRDLQDCFEKGDADKIRSIARYWLATDGQTLPRLKSWQLLHHLPYRWPISEDVYHDLFNSIGLNESAIQSYFSARAKRLSRGSVIAYDSITISTYSTNQIEARQGFNKEADGLDTIKLLTLYSVKDREPIAFSRQPGNLVDVVAIDNVLKQLSCFDISKPLIVTDNGYYSEANMLAFVKRNKKFMTQCKTSVKWVQECIDKVRPELESMNAVCPFDPVITGTTVSVMHKFDNMRQRSRGEYKAGETNSLERRLYVHVFRNLNIENKKELEMRKRLFELQKQLYDGQTEFKPAAQELIDKYLVQSRQGRGGALKIRFNDEAINQDKRYYGEFVLVSNEKMDCFEALENYRLREKIEELFAVEKQSMDGRRPRCWYSENLWGRQFVQFVGLGYCCFLMKKIKQVRDSLATDETLTKQEMEAEKKLKNWIDSNSLIQILEWFECVELVKYADEDNAQRMTEMTLRDQLFLKKLGVVM